MRGFLELLLLYPFTESIHKIKDWIEERERERERENPTTKMKLWRWTWRRSPVRRSPTKLWILDLVRWTWGLGLIVIDKYAITVGLVSNLNNLWALLWAFAKSLALYSLPNWALSTLYSP